MKCKEPSTLPGPYELMWLSDAECPVFEDVGLGIGCLKVKGNPQFSIPLCPAVIVLSRERDPIRKRWQPHGHSPVEPAVPADPTLVLKKRSWEPHRIVSHYRIDETEAVQETAVFSCGAIAHIGLTGPKAIELSGTSVGPCKLRQTDGGIHVAETGPSMRPFEYEIRISPQPQVSVLAQGNDTALAPGAVTTFPDGAAWSFSWDDTVQTVVVAVSVVLDATGPKEARAAQWAGADGRALSWQRYYEREVPRLETPDERLNQVVDYLAYVYRSNIVRLGGILPHRFSMPKETFNGFWMWDCCYHAIGARWNEKRDDVWGNLLNIENVQYPDGLDAAGCINNSAQPYGMQMFETDDPMSRRRATMPHTIPKKHGDGSHPPVFGQALRALWQTDGNRLLAERLLPNAIAYHDWFERTRESSSNPGLLLAKRWSDSGMDNSKRWGHQGSGIYDTALDERWWSMPVVTVDINVHSVLEKLALADVLEAFGMQAEADRMRDSARTRTDRVHEAFWDDQEGFYFDIDERSGKRIPVWSPTGFYPLLLDGIDASRVDRLLDRLFDEEYFWTAAPFPSIAANDPDFRPSHSYWRGCTWMSYTVYILRGLFRIAPDKGWRALDRILDVLLRGGSPQIFENYNPLTAEGQDCPNFGWHGMIADVVLTDMLGITIQEGKPVLGRCVCPPSWTAWTARNLSVMGKRYTVRGERTNDEWRAVIEEK